MREKEAAREKENIFSNGLIFPVQIFFSIFHDRLNLHLVKTGLKERKKERRLVLQIEHKAEEFVRNGSTKDWKTFRPILGK